MNTPILKSLLFLAATTMAAAGAEKVAAERLADLAHQAFEDATLTAEGQLFRLDMGTKRVNWNNARWRVLAFPAPRDLSKYGAVRLTVLAAKPTSRTGVYVALKEADGTWYAHGWAADLTQKTNVGLARFEDFRLCEWYTPTGGTQHDENGILDVGAIAAVAVGCVNPLGIGNVEFVLEDLSVVPLPAASPKPVAVSVTGKLLDVNGTRVIPAGLFGTYAQRNKTNLRKYRMAMQRHLFGTPGGGDEVTHMQIHCWGERTQAAVRLQEGWQKRCADAATAWAAAAKAAGKKLYVEFWNEPYLNWANRNRISFNPNYYDVSGAAEGAPVHIKHDGQVAPHLKWTRQFHASPWQWCRSRQEWRRGRDERGNACSPVHAVPYNRRGWQPSLHPPDDVKDGQPYKITRQVKQRDPKTKKPRTVTKEETLTAFTPWHIYDETQFTYWAGAGMLKLYVEPMLAFGKALKTAMPEATYYAGWGFRPSEDHWVAWQLLYKPAIDAGIQYIDGVHDHDYGSDPLKLAANYEVVEAYAVATHDKWLRFVNTEQGAQTDPQAYPKAADLSGEAYADLNKFRWSIRKMLHALQYVPDKARAFAHFGYWWSDSGQGVMFEILKNLRGRLVHVVCDDPFVYAVASIDGTDPNNPRPKEMPQRKELVVALLSDHASPRVVSVSIAAPAGTRFTRQATLRRMAIDKQTGRPGVSEAEVKWNGTDGSFSLREALAPHAAVAVTLPLTGEPVEQPQVRRRQVFGRKILADVTSAAPVEESISIDAATLGKARRAWIKFVAERLGRDEGVVTLNGNTYAMPSCITPENCPWIRRLPVRVADMKVENKLVFRVAGAEHAGYLLGMSSLVVECD